MEAKVKKEYQCVIKTRLH